MGRLAGILGLVATLLLPAVAFADPPVRVTLHYIPEGRMIELDHQAYRGYTLEEFKELLIVDHELHTTIQEVKELRFRLDAVNNKVLLLTQNNASLEEDLRKTRRMLETTNKTMRTATQRAIKAEGRCMWAYGIAGVTGTVTVVTLALILGSDVWKD